MSISAMMRFVRLIGTLRITSIDRTEAAGAGAHIAQPHDGGGTGTPPLAHIWAFGLLAHRRQFVLMDDGVDLFVGGPTTHADTQPVRFGQALALAA